MGATALALLSEDALATPVSVPVADDGVGVERIVDTIPGAFGPVSCPGHGAGGAIEKPVEGNWDRDAASFMPSVFPLGIAGAPPSMIAGQPLTVTVREFRTDDTATTPTAAGATVEGGGASAQTDAGGRATLVLANPGTATLRATRAGNVASDAVTMSVRASRGCRTRPPTGRISRRRPAGGTARCAASRSAGSPTAGALPAAEARAASRSWSTPTRRTSWRSSCA